jgi:hypothetical protein
LSKQFGGYAATALLARRLSRPATVVATAYRPKNDAPALYTPFLLLKNKVYLRSLLQRLGNAGALYFFICLSPLFNCKKTKGTI